MKRKTVPVWVVFSRIKDVRGWTKWYVVNAATTKTGANIALWREPGRQSRIVRVEVPVPDAPKGRTP